MFFKKDPKLFEQLPMLFFLVKWFILSLLSGSLIGSASALLLVSLNWATLSRTPPLDYCSLF